MKNKSIPSWREDAHKLFIRFERLSKFELQVHLAKVFEIAGKGGEVVGIEPLPRRGLSTC